MQGSSKGSIYRVTATLDAVGSQPEEEEILFGMVNESKFNVNDVRCFRRKMHKGDGYMDDSRTFTACTVKKCVSVHTTHIGS